MHAALYLLRLQIDHVVLDGHGQACPDMPKDAFETYTSKTVGVPELLLGHLPLGEGDHFTLYIDF